MKTESGKREKAKRVYKTKGLQCLKMLVVVAIVAFGFQACSETKRGRRSYVIADSKSYEASLFRANCAICHGKEAFGKTVDGKPVPSLRFGEAAKKTEEEIYQQIAHGKLPMPSFEGQLTEKEMRKMARWVFSELQGRDFIKRADKTK